MAYVTKSDLSACNSNINAAMANSDFVTLSKVADEIDKFISDSQTKLQGSGWDKVRDKLNIYLITMGLRSLVVSNLGTNSSSAISYLTNYLGEYDALDDSKTGEQEKLLANANSSLNSWEGKYNSAIADGDEVSMKNALNEMNKIRGRIRELEKLVDKLKSLSAADNAAVSHLEGSSSDVTKFGKGLSVIGPGSF